MVKAIKGEKIKFKIRTESISSALYFAEGQKIPFVQNVVTIDIGGGTSKIFKVSSI